MTDTHDIIVVFSELIDNKDKIEELKNTTKDVDVLNACHCILSHIRLGYEFMIYDIEFIIIKNKIQHINEEIRNILYAFDIEYTKIKN